MPKKRREGEEKEKNRLRPDRLWSVKCDVGTGNRRAGQWDRKPS